jgi:hypothetical protein
LFVAALMYSQLFNLLCDKADNEVAAYIVKEQSETKKPALRENLPPSGKSSGREI